MLNSTLQIKGEVNKFYKQVELDVDGVFKFMLLLRKKKYAAVSLSKLPSGELVEKQEMKGIDIVRRDWCQLAGEAGKLVWKCPTPFKMNHVLILFNVLG